MSAEVSRTKELHEKMLRYLLGSIVMIAAAAIASLALYLVLPDYLFPFAALLVFAVLVFLLTLLLEDMYYRRKEIGETTAVDNVTRAC
jgi:O-antigen/teichoic acid export membrane protein